MIDRAALRRAYRPDEQSVVVERLDQTRLAAAQAAEAQAIARALVKAVRGHKAAGLDAFLQARLAQEAEVAADRGPADVVRRREVDDARRPGDQSPHQ